jgi:cell division septal protein FtsQ
MWNKFINIFKWKKTRFRDNIIKEKSRFYMFDKGNQSISSNKRNKQFKIKFNYKMSRKIILIFSIFIFLSAFIWILYIFKWEYFSIKIINIKTDNITSEKIAYNAVNSIRHKSIFLENKDDIMKKILDYQRNIKTITINKILPDTLEINIVSFPIIMNLFYSNKKYSITSNWIIVPLKKINNKEEWKKILINIANTKDDKYKIISYKQMFKSDFIEKVYLLIKWFEDNIIDYNIKNINLYREEKELHIITDNNTIFIFSLELSIKKQLKKIIVYMKEKESSLRYIYIDLRIENKIFLCWYEEEYQCKLNFKRLYHKNVN